MTATLSACFCQSDPQENRTKKRCGCHFVETLKTKQKSNVIPLDAFSDVPNIRFAREAL